MPKIKNILIFTAVAVVFILIYIFFIKNNSEEATLVSSPSTPVSAVAQAEPGADSSVTKDFLVLLLNVKNIRLDDAIFADKAFESLRDSSITLVPDGNEGRPNPFAPLGTDVIPPSTNIGVGSAENIEPPLDIESPDI